MPSPAKGALLAEHLAWIRERFRAGVRNGDVIRQELLARGVVASLRTVNRALGPLRRELVLADRATIRFETPPGRQMQVDFGEKWLEVEGIQQKRYVFVATLGFSRRTFAMVFGSMRQRDWIMGIEGAFRHFEGVPLEILSANAKPLSCASKAAGPYSIRNSPPSAATGGSVRGPASPTAPGPKGRWRTGSATSKATPWGACPSGMMPSWTSIW